MGLVVALVAVWMGWIELPDINGEGDSGISLYLQMDDGSLVPLGDGKTMSIQALSIYYNGQRIQGVTGILNLKPTLSSGDDASVAIHWTGNWKIVGFIAGTNTSIFNRPAGYWTKAPDPTNIPTNTWTNFSEYPASFSEPELGTLGDGNYTFTWAANGTASHSSSTATWNITVGVTITKTADTLTILADIVRSHFGVLG